MPEFGVPGPMSEGVIGSEGGGGRLISVGVDIFTLERLIVDSMRSSKPNVNGFSVTFLTDLRKKSTERGKILLVYNWMKSVSGNMLRVLEVIQEHPV